MTEVILTKNTWARERSTDGGVFMDGAALGDSSNLDYHLGFTFNDLPEDFIQGITINTAVFGYSQISKNGSSMSTDFHVERSDSSANITTGNSNLTNRTWSTAQVNNVHANWSASEPGTLSTDLSVPLQEFFDNHTPATQICVYFFVNSASQNHQVQLGSGSSNAATLTIDYTPVAAAGGGGGAASLRRRGKAGASSFISGGGILLPRGHGSIV